jgi:hypothetical protein
LTEGMSIGVVSAGRSTVILSEGKSAGVSTQTHAHTYLPTL